MVGSGTTRDRILDATECLLTRLGYRKMTMDDMAQEAGIGKRTIYVYFPSKEEVALASIDRVVDRLTSRLRNLAQVGGPPDQRLRQMLLCRILYRFDSVQGYSHRLDGLFESLRPAYMSRRRRYFEEEASIFTNVLAEGRDAGFFTCDDPARWRTRCFWQRTLFFPTASTLRNWVGATEVEINAERIADLLLNGIRRRPPSSEPHSKVPD